MVNLVDFISSAQRSTFKLFARPSTYVLNDGATTSPLLSFLRGLRSEDLFAAAQQQDLVAVIDCAEFVAAFPSRQHPMRYDRLRSGTFSYAIEQWRGSPNDDAPTFFKLLLRGGAQ